MKQQLDELNRQAMVLITEFAEKNDPATIAGIASTANKIRQLSDKLDEIQHEIPRLKEELVKYGRQQAAPPSTQADSRPANQPKQSRKKIRIEIDWTRMGKAAKGKQVISEHMASDSLTKWVISLYQELGEKVLTTFHNVRINRGPLTSSDPQADFKNHADGTLYQHQPILDTGYHVLTHSNTAQKIGDIQKACRALGLPVGMVNAVEVEK